MKFRLNSDMHLQVIKPEFILFFNKETSLIFYLNVFISLSHRHILSLSLALTHTHTLSLSLSRSLSLYIYTHRHTHTHTHTHKYKYSALQKYWNSKDKICSVGCEVKRFTNMIKRWIWDKTTECHILLLGDSTHTCFTS